LHEGGRKMMDICCYYNQLQQNEQSYAGDSLSYLVL